MSELAASPRAARSVKRILDAAARMFGREGYRGASMTAVAAAAGVSKGLLHYHFTSKEHLLIEAQRSTFREVYRRFQDRFDRGERTPSTALEALDALWSSLLDMRDWAPFMVETLTLSHQEPQVRAHLDDFYAEAQELLERGLAEVWPEDPALPNPRLARVVRTALHGLVVELSHVRSEPELALVRQTYLDLRRLLERAVLTPPQEVLP